MVDQGPLFTGFRGNQQRREYLTKEMSHEPWTIVFFFAYHAAEMQIYNSNSNTTKSSLMRKQIEVHYLFKQAT